MVNKIYTLIKKEENGNVIGVFSTFDESFAYNKYLDLQAKAKEQGDKVKYRVIQTDIKYNYSEFTPFATYEGVSGY